MKACDIMTTGLVTITPQTPIDEIAQLLLDRHISGLPVVDADGRVVGIVSEGDLIRRQELETGRQRSWWLELLSSRTGLARDYAKFHGRTASDIMTRDVVAVDENASLAEIASTLESKRIKRVPVCRGDKLVGIISRANLVQALALTWKKTGPAEASIDDRQIRQQLADELAHNRWADLRHLNFLVDKGTVHLWGVVESEEERQAVRVAAGNIPGVRQVNDDLVPQAHSGLNQSQANRFP
ncbi:MAG TPA: CBS domain-containing protein [Arenibaculum sp.]|nr:CBS domain-containing protein [Arenibaculum sp.]